MSILKFFLEKNQIITGIIIGLLVPFVGFAVLLMIFEQLEAWGIMNPKGMAPNFRQRTSSLIAICLNLLPMNYYRKKYYFESMRGLVFPTLLYVAIWIIVFASSLFATNS